MDPKPTQIKGGIPEHYDRGLGPYLFTEPGRDLANRIAAFNPSRVLELAAGTGILSRFLRDVLDTSCQLTVTDIVGPMLDLAKRKFTPGESVQFEVADAQKLPFDSQSFDTLVCQFGVMLFPQKMASYKEAFRVLTPGGHYLFNVWRSFEDNTFAQITHQTLSSFFESNPPGFWQMPFSYSDPEQITQSLEAAGFCDIQVQDQQFQKTVEDCNRFAQGLVFGNPLVNEIRTRGTIEPEIVSNAIADALRSELGTEPTPIVLNTLVISGTRPQ